MSFESRGRLYFLFGDSSLVFSGRPWWGGGTLLDDSIAVTDARSVDRFQMPRLSWAAGADGSFAPLRVPGASHGGFEVPVEGIHANGRTYVFLVSGWHREELRPSVLGHFDADTMQTGRFVFDQVVESSRFLNVSAVEYQGYVYLFGAGNPYRRSAVRLARFRAHAIDRRDQWRYLGQPLGDGRLAWVQGETQRPPDSAGRPALRRRAVRAPRSQERPLPDGLQLRRRPRRPPARLLPAHGAPALGAVERTDRDVRRHGGRRRLRRHPALARPVGGRTPTTASPSPTTSSAATCSAASTGPT